jgi:hypothetical protein
MQGPFKKLSEALEGIEVGGSLTGVMQGVGARHTASGTDETRASYRGDLTVTLPGGEMGDTEGKIFTHFRFGQGTGIGLRPTYTSTANTTAFQTNAGADDSFAILAQAWYQLKIAADGRRLQGQRARAPVPDRRQDRPLRLLRPERHRRRRVVPLPQQRLRAQPAARFRRRHPRRRLRLCAGRHRQV